VSTASAGERVQKKAYQIGTVEGGVRIYASPRKVKVVNFDGSWSTFPCTRAGPSQKLLKLVLQLAQNSRFRPVQLRQNGS
jgi:hypothetical protein